MTSTGKRIVLIGATGMVGGEVLQLALADPDVALVTAIGRRPPSCVGAGFSRPVAHPRLVAVQHDDFSDCTRLSDTLATQDAALFCLGSYTGVVSDAELRRTTVDYPAAFARALAASSPDTMLCLLSGSGADQTGKTRVAFARYKGEAEKALLTSGLRTVYSFRAGYVYPAVRRNEPHFGYTLMRWSYPVLRHVVPNMVITSRELARAMLFVAVHGTTLGPMIENDAILVLAKAAGARARSRPSSESRPT